jgi:hypothetical protein
MEGKWMFGQKYQGNASQSKPLEDNAFKGGRERHDMVEQVRSRLVMVMHVMIIYVRVMHVMVWNVREMHVWIEMSGQGIT